MEASLHKINTPAWVVTGDALKGFFTGALQIPAEGRAPIAFDWYRTFIQSLLDAQAYTWFAKVIAYGKMLVGIALIIGAFTGNAPRRRSWRRYLCRYHTPCSGSPSAPSRPRK